MDFPPYPCSGNEPIFTDIQLLDYDGNIINYGIVASECFAAWYCSFNNCTWRHAPTEEE